VLEQLIFSIYDVVTLLRKGENGIRMKQKCQTCKIEKSLSDFHKNKNMISGHTAQCKHCTSLRSKRRYQKDGVKIRQQMAEQRRINYEHRIEIERKSRSKNKEKYRPIKNATQSKRNRLLNKKEYKILPKELYKVYNSSCWACGGIQNISLDHIVPLSRGGAHSVGNMLSLCRSCNSSKGNRLLSEWRYKNTAGDG